MEQGLVENLSRKWWWRGGKGDTTRGKGRENWLEIEAGIVGGVAAAAGSFCFDYLTI